jgi:hypothetical protein
MAGCNCGKNRVRPAWQPRGAKKTAAAATGSGTRIVTPEERAGELANGRPARAKQPGGR